MNNEIASLRQFIKGRIPYSKFDVERSMFDVYPPSAAPEATRVHLFHAKQIPSGDSQSLVLWAGILCFVPGPLCLSSYMITKEKISVIISVDRWLSDYN